jgi:SAM-dependent methyltransferase
MKRNSQLPSPQSGYDRANAAGCPCCNSDDLMIFHRTKRVPVNSVLNISSRDEALLFPRGDIYLGFCRKCGFIYNTKFDPALVQYSSDCEESQGYSPTFNSFARELADNLIKKYHLSHKKIIEIGCGKGEFLKLICDLGQNTGVGFDPAYVARGRDEDTSGRITFIKDYYSEKYANFRGDMVCCRMTLEHIYHTADMVPGTRCCSNIP